MLLAAADVAVVPSVHDEAGNVDGLPNTVMEIMASGTPLVTTPVGGIGAVATDGDDSASGPRARRSRAGGGDRRFAEAAILASGDRREGAGAGLPRTQLGPCRGAVRGRIRPGGTLTTASMFRRREHILILTAAAIGIAARLAFGLLYWVDKPLTHDEREYLTLAANLSAGRGFTYDLGTGSDPRTGRVRPTTAPPQQFGRAPGYPAFLATIGASRGNYAHSPARVKVVQAIVGGATVWLIGLIALDAAGPRAGVIAAALAAVYPPLVWISAYVFSESLYSLVALLTAFVLQLAAPQVGARARTLTIVAGMLAGLAILIRPAMLFYVPLATFWLLRRRDARLAIVFVLAAAAIVVPWTARNAVVHERFVLVASEGGVTFWTGNHPLARGEGDLAANPELETADLEFRKAHPGLSAEELERFYYRDALQWIASEPLQWFVFFCGRCSTPSHRWARRIHYTRRVTGPHR